MADLPPLAPLRNECGGCAGMGAHRRWCPAVVGHFASVMGRRADLAESMGDGVGVPEIANLLWGASAMMRERARIMAERWEAGVRFGSEADGQHEVARGAEVDRGADVSPERADGHHRHADG